MLEGRKKQFDKAVQDANEIVFLDRGVPDILAYMHYIGDSYPSFFDKACNDIRYSKIFLLPPWENIYVSDEARYENFEQAKLIYDHSKETYKKYDYQLIEVPTGTIEERIQFILSELD